MAEVVIHALDRRETKRTLIRPDHYTLRPEKGWVRVQKACLWVLKKIGALATEEKVDVQVLRFDPDVVVEALYKQRQMLARLEYGKVSKVYLGSGDLERMLGQRVPNTRFEFGAEYFQNRTLMGLQCEVIPWMEGILIV